MWCIAASIACLWWLVDKYLLAPVFSQRSEERGIFECVSFFCLNFRRATQHSSVYWHAGFFDDNLKSASTKAFHPPCIFLCILNTVKRQDSHTYTQPSKRLPWLERIGRFPWQTTVLFKRLFIVWDMSFCIRGTRRDRPALSPKENFNWFVGVINLAETALFFRHLEKFKIFYSCGLKRRNFMYQNQASILQSKHAPTPEQLAWWIGNGDKWSAASCCISTQPHRHSLFC